MIRIATDELTDALHNVALFADDARNLTNLDFVSLHWDGRRLHIQARDRYMLAWAAPEIGPLEDGEAPDWPWTACLSVKTITTRRGGLLRTLTPGKGDGATWTTITLGARLRFEREASPSGKSPAATFEASLVDRSILDIRRLLAGAWDLHPVDTLAISPWMVATLGRLRSRTVQPLILRTTGNGTLVHVQYGNRFRAAFQPVDLNGCTPDLVPELTV